MLSDVQFDYSKQAVFFLEERIDENDAYADAIKVFEDLVRRYPKIGDPMDRPPLVFRRLPIRIPNVRELAFYYVMKGNRIEVFRVEFADETPI
jgi:hypothetical protein